MKFFLFSIIISVFISFKHPYYLGVVDMKYNQKDSAFEGSIKLFTNDFENTLKKIHNKTIDLINPQNKDETTKILSSYLNDHFSIKINGKQKNYKLIGFETEQDVTWLFLEFEISVLPKKIEIENSLLYNNKDQMNIVHLEVNNFKKSFKVTNPEKKLMFEF